MSDSTDLRRVAADTVWHSLAQHQQFKDKPPLHVVSAKGCFLQDSEGNQILDALAGLWCVNIGYGRAELGEIAAKQMTELSYLAPVMSHPSVAKMAQKLLDLLGIRGHVYFANSGSEANETAFKIARQFHMQNGSANKRRYKIISRHRAYHGSTLAAMSATGQAERKMGYEPLAPGFLHIPPPYPYRRHASMTVEEHGEFVAAMLEETINYEGAETVAAFIMEPMISGGGVIIPPDNYLSRVREICDRHGVLLIFDEVVSGFGRTGTMFGHQHWGVKPDILTTAKGIASGYMPLSACIVNEDIFEGFYGEPSELKHFRHVNTYSGHPVSTAVGLKNIEIIEEEQLADNAANMGAYIRQQLNAFAETNPYIGEVRGKGLLIGVEAVANKDSKEPLPSAKVASILATAKEQGVMLGRNGTTVPNLDNVIIMAPPLVLKQSEADQIVDAVKAGFERLLN